MKNTTPKIIAICVLIFLTGIVLSFYLYSSLNSTNELKRDQILSSYFNNVYNGIQNEIDRNLNALYAIREFYLADGEMDYREFSAYASYYTQNINSIQALEWVPVIPFDKKDSFELSMQAAGFEDFQIFTRENDKIVRVEDREKYFPVAYIQPFEGNEAALGFDPGNSLEFRQDAINRAMKNGKSAASGVISIIQKNEPHKAILVFVPVIDPKNQKTIALVEGVYLMRSLIDVAIENIDLPKELCLEIKSKGDDDQLLFGDPKHLKESASIHKNIELEMADQIWELGLHYNGQMGSTILTPIFVLIAGIVFTLLLVRVVYIFLTDNRKALQKYVKELENKNRDLEQYAYVASHDLQEPLHSLQGLVTIINQEYRNKFNDEGKLYLDHIVMASKRMASLIKNLLQYSQIGQMEKPEEVNCNEVLKDVSQDLRNKIKDKNVQIKINNELPTVWGYPDALHQLFQNLISNGIKFQSNGNNPIVEISSKRNENNAWQFSVKDNGIGFPKSHVEKIFVIFKRLHSNSKYSGTGIGLANCKKIVELHYGKIWAESEEGKGSTFYFTLNLSK